MYDPKIEELINAALADGVLTEKEKQILYKKAASMGIDLDEFEMVLQSKLYDKQKEIDKAKAESSASPKSNKMGDIKKCPACGAIISNYQATCPECGYEFSDVKANLSSRKLAAKLEEVRKRQKSPNSIAQGLLSGLTVDDTSKEQSQIIETFPIPNTKADLLEFITSLQARAYVDVDGPVPMGEQRIQQAYAKKLNECIAKAKINFPNDPMFKSAIAEAEKRVTDDKKKRKKQMRIIALIPIICFSLLIGGIVCAITLPYDESDCVEDVTSSLAVNDPVKAESYINKYDGYPEKAYQLLVAYYIKENDVDNLERLSKSHIEDGSIVNEQIYQFFIKEKLYDEAKQCVGGSISIETYIKDVVNSMCKDNKEGEAVKFVKRESLNVSDYERDEFVQNVLNIIESY